MKFTTAHEENIFNQATYFVAVRGRNRFNRTRDEFPCIEEAKQFASNFGDNRTMIYAVNKHGSAANICNA